MIQRSLFLVILVYFIACFSSESPGKAATPNVVLRESVASSCEVAQPGILEDHGRYASVIIVGTGEEVFSPELGKNDTLDVASNLPKSMLKLAQKSGFRLSKNGADKGSSPRVLKKEDKTHCPTIEEAIRAAALNREARRHEVQSKLHHPGSDGVTPPGAIASPPPKSEPDASTKSTSLATASTSSPKTKMEGTVILAAIVGTDGSVPQIKVVRSVTAELDQKAMEAVKSWKFTPATKDGLPVPVLINVEVNFHLH